QPQEPGPLVISRRGKQTFIGAGRIGVQVSWALEGLLVPFSRDDYEDIIAHDSPGNNPCPIKCERLRTFELPAKYQDEFSNPSSTRRTLTILAAFVTPERAYSITDNDRFLRFHVTTLDRFWSEEDMEPKSELWPVMWAHFKSGPDWHYEHDEAMEGLDRWRDLILSKNDFNTTVLAALLVGDYSNLFFASFGRHTANDAIHELRLFPGEPVINICSDDNRFQAFKTGLDNYIAQFESSAYIKECCNRSTSTNPLSFQKSVDDKYSSKYMRVFRKASVLITIEHWNEFARLGYFDPNHRIGTPYQIPPGAIITSPRSKHVRVPVWHRTDTLDAYTIIRAKAPVSGSWTDGAEEPAQDHRLDGYKSTVGPANFRILKTNKTHVETAIKHARPGRPKK
ncbi:hypothetical protein BDZ89DRAFT_913731, partial [Hymenopellis radicata]